MIVEHNNDASLLLEMKFGNQQAFETLYNKYKGLLYVHAYRKLKDREQVKDIIHEIFLSLWEKKTTLDIKGELSSYLFKAVRYKIIDTIDRSSTAEQYISHFQSFIESYPSQTDHRVREKILTSIIDKEIVNLPARMREVFEMSRKENLTHAEIAEKLNISEQSVRSHIKNALRILRVRLSTYLPLLLFLFNK
jgi:RNA polymerase sigma-70 factor (family 1)